MQVQIEEFKTLLIEIEEEFYASSTINTDKIIRLLDNFSEFYRGIDIRKTLHFWSGYLGSLTNILTCWAHSNAELTSNQLAALTKRKSLLSSIFLTGFDFQQKALLRNFNPERKFTQNSTKVLLLLSINNLNKIFFRSYLNAPNEIAFYLAIGWLSERSQMTKSAAVFHQKIIDDFERFSEASVDVEFLNTISKAYMYTTYSSSVGKDKIKGSLHKIIAKEIEKKAQKGSLNICRENIRKKPKLLIVHEYFSDTHVMMRIFMFIFKLLEKSFDVYNLTWTDEPSKASSSELKNVVYCEQDLSYIIASIKFHSPDVIFYPSLGMSTFAIALASFRLAPIQLQGFGHPSASHSPHIDGSIHNSSMFSSSGPELYTTYPGYKHGIHLPFTLKLIDKDISHEPVSKSSKRLNIAVNAKVMKLNPDFMIFLSKINFGQNATLNFFPAESGTEFLVCRNFINAYFPSALVHHMEDYETFMRQLSMQDLALCPFPFGNTNGILDCIHLGLPTFVLKGTDVCSSAEFDLLKYSGNEDCIFRTKGSLKLAIENFISDEDFRITLTDKFQKAAALCVEQNDIGAAQDYEARNFAIWINEHVKNYRSSKDV